MKTIAYYVTDSGFGHITRSAAIISHIIENSDYNVILASNKIQNDHAKIELRKYEKRVSFINVETDANSKFIENSHQVDLEGTAENIRVYTSKLEDLIEYQYNLLKGMEIVMVITDISILGIMVAKKLRVKVVGISNYTWYNRFKNFGIENDLIEIYRTWYNQLDMLYRFELSDDMSGIDCPKEDVGLVCRDVSQMSSGDFKKLYWPAVYLSVGQVEKKKEKFKIDFPSGTVFATGTIEVEGNVHVVKLPSRLSHTQDYIAASSFALIKGGWSSVAECLILDVPFGILDEDDTEDQELVEKLFSNNYAFRTTEEELRKFHIKDMNIKAVSVNRPHYTNDANNIAQKMLRVIN
ncbi:hypothetical protein [Petrocella sp. FN5]|uniref:hypothetical protein n=1 Tax=Petrocella sp. FN5 TaxID=3032002 RepID=UPI0023DCEB61|nr:hypothetical protein [Petrocella sp. FN5]MDF1618365.1 hypothetical protein [Petrocella sp. FN5]